MTNDNRDKSVVVLDSGIGGMTVVKAIREINNTISVPGIPDNALSPVQEDKASGRLGGSGPRTGR